MKSRESLVTERAYVNICIDKKKRQMLMNGKTLAEIEKEVMIISEGWDLAVG